MNGFRCFGARGFLEFMIYLPQRQKKIKKLRIMSISAREMRLQGAIRILKTWPMVVYIALT